MIISNFFNTIHYSNLGWLNINFQGDFVMKTTCSLETLYSLTTEQKSLLSRCYPLWVNCLITSRDFANKLKVTKACFEEIITVYDSLV